MILFLVCAFLAGSAFLGLVTLLGFTIKLCHKLAVDLLEERKQLLEARAAVSIYREQCRDLSVQIGIRNGFDIINEVESVPTRADGLTDA